MIAKVFVCALLAALAVAEPQADRFPAGLNPALCPGYPNCDNSLLALYGPGGPAPHALPRAREYPAGVSPASCPNYPYCNVHVYAAPLPGFTERLYPAGVSPAACPGYPYC